MPARPRDILDAKRRPEDGDSQCINQLELDLTSRFDHEVCLAEGLLEEFHRAIAGTVAGGDSSYPDLFEIGGDRLDLVVLRVEEVEPTEEELERISGDLRRDLGNLHDPRMGTAGDEDWPLFPLDNQRLLSDRCSQFPGGADARNDFDLL